MDFRAKFIKDGDTADSGLFGLFKSHRDDRETDPIEIKTIGVGLNDPAKLNENQLPAVFFHYGATRRIEPETVGFDRETFTVVIEATINKGIGPDSDFISRSGAMRLLIDEMAQASRASHITDEVALENVVVASATPYTDTLNRFAFIVFELMYIYEFQY